MAVIKDNECPKCSSMHKDCFANHGGHCVCLRNTEFRHRDGTAYDCPFYKTKTRLEAERKKANERLEAIESGGRFLKFAEY